MSTRPGCPSLVTAALDWRHDLRVRAGHHTRPRLLVGPGRELGVMVENVQRNTVVCPWQGRCVDLCSLLDPSHDRWATGVDAKYIEHFT